MRPSFRVGLAAAGFALVLVLVAAAVTDGSIYQGDPLSFLRVARSPFGDGAALEPDAAVHGVAYRFGRILYPLLAWLLAGGQRELVEWTLPLVSVAAFGLCAVAASELASEARRPPLFGALVVCVPTLITSTATLYGDAVGVALLLGAYAFHLRGQRRAAWLAAALVPLAREALLVALVPMALDHLRRHRGRALVHIAGALVPVTAWYLWVQWRVGELPFLDDSVSRREALGLPFVGAARAIDDANGDAALVAGTVLVALLAVATVGLALRFASSPRTACWRGRRSCSRSWGCSSALRPTASPATGCGC